MAPRSRRTDALPFCNGAECASAAHVAHALGRAPDDCVAVRDDLGLYVVADGLSGLAHAQEGAARATGTLVARFARIAREPRTASFVGACLAEATRAADKALRDLRRNEGADVRVTLSAFALTAEAICVAHVGSGAVLRLRGQVVERLTRDDSLGALVPEARERFHRSFARKVLRSLPYDCFTADVELRTLPRGTDDAFLAVTDGLLARLDDDTLTRALFDGGLTSAPARLAAALAAHRDADDASFVLVAPGPRTILADCGVTGPARAKDGAPRSRGERNGRERQRLDDREERRALPDQRLG